MDYSKIAMAFLEGLGMILSPCILPILPILLAGGTSGGRKRPLGIITGFIITFSLVTLLLRALIRTTGLSAELIRYVAFALLFLFAIIMLISPLFNLFSRATQRFANTGANNPWLNNPDGGFLSGALLGSIVSFLWTPCAGPLLAAVIIQTATSQTNIESVFIIIGFSMGSALPMLLITLLGRKILTYFQFIQNRPNLMRTLFGSIILISAILLATGISNEAIALQSQRPSSLLSGIKKPYPAPKFTAIQYWLNSKPLTIKKMKGKIVLLDFFSSTCIVCKREMPFVNQLYRQNKAKPLVIIGIHSPEYPFSAKIAYIKRAIKKWKIRFPVGIDNHFKTFLAYKNKYWPSYFLINAQGQVVYQQIGGGQHQKLKHNIRVLIHQLRTTKKPQKNTYLKTQSNT